MIKIFGKKMLITIFLVILFRVGSVFPVPFIDTSVLKLSMKNVGETIFGLFNMMSGGGLSQASILAMGVSPYINASIIVQLLTVAIPFLENMKKEGISGVKKLNRMTRYLSIVLSILQAVGFYAALSSWGALSGDGVLVTVVIVLSFTVGSAFVMWLGERLTESGVGNGISILLVAGILSGLPSGVISLSVIKPVYLAFIIAVIVFISIVFVVFMNESEQRIPVRYSRAIGRYQNGSESYLPLKVNMSGVMPVIFASTILSIPQTLVMFVPSFLETDIGSKILSVFSSNNIVYGIIYFVLIILFNYFYVSIQYDPVQMSNTLKQNGGMIHGVRPGSQTSKFIAKSINRITFIDALFLAVIAVVPIILNTAFGGFSFYLGGTSLLIVVGVFIETVRQIQTMTNKGKKLIR